MPQTHPTTTRRSVHTNKHRTRRSKSSKTKSQTGQSASGLGAAPLMEARGEFSSGHDTPSKLSTTISQKRIWRTPISSLASSRFGGSLLSTSVCKVRRAERQQLTNRQVSCRFYPCRLLCDSPIMHKRSCNHLVQSNHTDEDIKSDWCRVQMFSTVRLRQFNCIPPVTSTIRSHSTIA